MAQIGEDEFQRLHRVLQRFYRMIVDRHRQQRPVAELAGRGQRRRPRRGRVDLPARRRLQRVVGARPPGPDRTRRSRAQRGHGAHRGRPDAPTRPCASSCSSTSPPGPARCARSRTTRELAHGGPIRWTELAPATRNAWILAGATVVNCPGRARPAHPGRPPPELALCPATVRCCGRIDSQSRGEAAGSAAARCSFVPPSRRTLRPRIVAAHGRSAAIGDDAARTRKVARGAIHRGIPPLCSLRPRRTGRDGGRRDQVRSMPRYRPSSPMSSKAWSSRSAWSLPDRSELRPDVPTKTDRSDRQAVGRARHDRSCSSSIGRRLRVARLQDLRRTRRGPTLPGIQELVDLVDQPRRCRRSFQRRISGQRDLHLVAVLR